MKIGKKIAVSFLVITLLLLFISITGYVGISNLVTLQSERDAGTLDPAQNLAASTAAIEKIRGDLILYLASPAERGALEASIDQQIAIVDKNVAEYSKKNLNADERASLSRFMIAWQTMQDDCRRIISDAKVNDAKTSNGKAATIAPAIDSSLSRAYNDALTEIRFESSQINAAAEQSTREINASAAFMQGLLLLATFLAVIFCVIVAWCLTRSLVDPIQKITRGIHDFHEGRVSNRVSLNRKDELGEMGEALDRFSADFEKYILGTMNMVADGDLSRNLKPRSEKDEMIPPIKKMIETLRALIGESNALSKAAVEGKLSVRGNAAQFKGGYWEIIAGINKTMDQVVNPLQEGMRVSAEYANGNFTARFDQNIEVHGDFKKFRKSLDNIGTEISAVLNSVQKQTSDLSAAAEQAAAGTLEVTTGAHQIADNARKVSENSGKCTDGIEQVLKAVEDMATAVQEVTTNMEHVSQQANHASDEARKGAALAGDVERDMNDIASSTDSVFTIVQEIEKQMNEITKIVGLIRDLANQTNLLALNAAIEAARAGESGRGFAVVASEVKSLAEESRASAEKIEQMINELNRATKNAAAATDTSKELVTKGAKMSAETIAAFRTITEAAEKVAGAAAEVAAATEEQAATSQEITASMHEVEEQVRKTTGEAGMAASATEKTASSIADITKVVASVNNIVENVSHELKRFTI